VAHPTTGNVLKQSQTSTGRAAIVQAILTFRDVLSLAQAKRLSNSGDLADDRMSSKRALRRPAIGLPERPGGAALLASPTSSVLPLLTSESQDPLFRIRPAEEQPPATGVKACRSFAAAAPPDPPAGARQTGGRCRNRRIRRSATIRTLSGNQERRMRPAVAGNQGSGLSARDLVAWTTQ
jgi:hypothetical protein